MSVDFTPLWQEIKLAFLGKVSPTDLESRLRKYKTLLLSPLEHEPPRSADRNALTNDGTIEVFGTMRAFNENSVEMIVNLSDTLKLSETVCAELVQAYIDQQDQFVSLGADCMNACIDSFHANREIWIFCLRELLRGRELDAMPGVRDTLIDFTDSLVAEGLGLTLAKLLTRLNADIANAGNDKVVMLLGRERLRVAQCLLYLHFQVMLPSEAVVELLCAFRETATLARNVEHDSNIFATAVVLCLATVTAIDATKELDPVFVPAMRGSTSSALAALRNGGSGGTDGVSSMTALKSNTKFIKAFTKELDKTPNNVVWDEHTHGLQSLVVLAWALFLQASPVEGELTNPDTTIRELVNQAVKKDFFRYTAEVVVPALSFEASLDAEDSRPYYLSILDSLLTAFIIDMPDKVRNLKAVDEEETQMAEVALQQAAEQSRYAVMGGGVLARSQTSTVVVARHDFQNLLFAVGRLYEGEPVLALKFWEYHNYAPLAERFPEVLRPRHRHLHYFLRFSAEYPNAKVFIVYVDMLSSLVGDYHTALCAYDFLTNTTDKIISWNHFCYCLGKYHLDMLEMQESQAAGAAAGGAGPGGVAVVGGAPSVREIRPEDVYGLIAILKLMQKVLTYYRESRAYLLDNPNWNSLATLFGLVACSVPPILKAHMLRTIAAFARDRELRPSIWQSLEASRILATTTAGELQGSSRNASAAALAAARRVGMVRDTSMLVASMSGIKYELEEVESRNETYPETLGFLHLVHYLASTGIVETIGAGLRVPGFVPYLSFIRDDVFLKFDTRGYKFPNEKWVVAAACLNTFYKILVLFEPSIDDFADSFVNVQGQAVRANKRTGFELLRSLLAGSGFVRKISLIIAEGLAVESPPRELNAAVLNAIRLLELAFRKEEVFVDLLRASNTPMYLKTMDSLLQEDSQRILDIARHATVRDDASPEITFYAIRVLFHLSQRRVPLVAIFTAAGASDEILAGFIAKLRGDENPPMDDDDPMAELVSMFGEEAVHDPNNTDAFAEMAEDIHVRHADVDDELMGISHESTVTHSVHRAILQLLNANVGLPPPNMAHFLLGFKSSRRNARRHGSATYLSGYSCLHIIVNRLLETHYTDLYPRHGEEMAELIYRLCTDKKMFGPVMQFLRTYAGGYFVRSFLDLKYRLVTGAAAGRDAATTVSALNLQAWTLRALAMEIRVTGDPSSPYHIHAQRLLPFIFASGRELEELVRTDPDLGDAYDVVADTTRVQLLDIVRGLDFAPFDPPDLAASLNAIDYESTLVVNERGVSVFDIKALHQLLLAEQRRVEMDFVVSGTTQRTHLDREIQHILDAVLAWNTNHELHCTYFSVLDAWCQVVEATLATGFEVLRSDMREAVIFGLLDELLARLIDAETDIAIATRTSSVIFALMTKLRQQKLQIEGTPGDVDVGFRMPVDQLHRILRGLLTGVLRSGSSQLLRGNLYASLMHYLQYTTTGASSAAASGADGSMSMSMSMSMTLSGNAAGNGATQRLMLERGSYEILESYGDRLRDVITRDATDGADIWKSVAFGLLDLLVRGDLEGKWLVFLARKGALETFLKHLSARDSGLAGVLSSNPASLNAMYIFQSKISVLTRMALTQEGASALKTAGLFRHLVECSFIDQRPEVTTIDYQSFVPAVLERYHELLTPVLRLVVGVQSSLAEDTDCADKVISFVEAHTELFLIILKDRVPVITIASLAEVSLATSIFYHMLQAKPDLSGTPLAAHASAIQNLLLNILAKYCDESRWWPRVEPITMDEKRAASSADQGSIKSAFRKQAERAVLAILRNVLFYCRVATDPRPPELSFRPIFSPSTVGLASGKLSNDHDVPLAISSVTRLPSLAVLLHIVREATDELFQIRPIDKLPNEDVGGRPYTNRRGNFAASNGPGSVFAGASTRRAGGTSAGGADGVTAMDAAATLSPDKRRRVAQRVLVAAQAAQEREVDALVDVVETAMLVLLRHLEYYLTEVQIDFSAAGGSGAGGADTGVAGSVLPGAFSADELGELLTTAQSVLAPAMTNLAKLGYDDGGIAFRNRDPTFVLLLVRRFSSLFLMAGRRLERFQGRR